MNSVVGYPPDPRFAAPADEPGAEACADQAIEASLAQIRRDQALEASFARARVDRPLEASRTLARGEEGEARLDEAPEAPRVPGRTRLDPLSVAVWASALVLLALVVVGAHLVSSWILAVH
jgi:hypothetical protein